MLHLTVVTCKEGRDSFYLLPARTWKNSWFVSIWKEWWRNCSQSGWEWSWSGKLAPSNYQIGWWADWWWYFFHEKEENCRLWTVSSWDGRYHVAEPPVWRVELTHRVGQNLGRIVDRCPHKDTFLVCCKYAYVFGSARKLVLGSQIFVHCRQDICSGFRICRAGGKCLLNSVRHSAKGHPAKSCLLQ